MTYAQFDLMCPACHRGAMVRTGEKVKGIVHRQCTACGFRAKYMRVPITDAQSARLVLNRDQKPE
jgi:uncharacterized protein (DUF983 family)